MILEIEPGKQIIVTSDSRAEGVYIKLHAFGGSLGLELTDEQTRRLVVALMDARRKRG